MNRSIGQAQKRVEQHNFEIRKRTLEYDDVMNKQREVIYGFRNEIIHAEDVRDRLMDIMEEVVIQKVEQFTSAEDEDRSDWKCAVARGLGEPELPDWHARGGDRQGGRSRQRGAGQGRSMMA